MGTCLIGKVEGNIWTWDGFFAEGLIVRGGLLVS
jgi:hypothetical protein